ncbi:MAG: ABC transporter permease [Dehalococcoidia bacterium]|nr:ABC transporter permease [Dehalococcoidia bacterium]
MTPLRHIWFIALKDLKIFAKDRLALFFAILFPFLFVVLFSVVLGGIESEDERLELHLVTQEDRGGLSHHILKAIETEDESELDPGEPEIVWDADYEKVNQLVAEQKLAGFVAFPEDFAEGISMGYGANLGVVVDPEDTYTRAALNSLAEAIASRVGQQHVASSAISGLLLERWLESPGDMTRIGQEMPELLSVSAQGGVPTRSSLIEYEVEKVGEVEAEEPSNYVIPGYLVMFVFFTAALSAENIVRERQNHTLERMLAGSVRRESILGGIFTGTAAKGLIQLLIFWTVGILVFNIDLGLSPAAVILLSLLMVIMSSAFAIMLATLVKTQRSAGSIASLTSLALAPLGGCWWPLFILPKWMQFIAKMTPHGWANTGFNKLMVFGADFSAAVPEMLALVAFAAVFGIIAILRFRTSAV